MLRRLVNGLFGGSASATRPLNHAKFGSEFEHLGDRITPAVVTFQVNVTDDTRFDHTIVNEQGQVVNVVDANNNTSLRAVVEYANAHPQNGNWNDNHYNVDLSGIAGQTITLNPNAVVPTLVLTTNFNFLTNGPNVTISRPTAAGTPDYNHFDVFAGAECHWIGITLVNGSNTADSGGSIWNMGNVQFENCTFMNNATTRYGGAIATLIGATTIVNGCEFWYNFAELGGGAIAARPGSAATNITDCLLTENDTEGDGGAVWGEAAGSLWIQGSTITVNRALGGVGVSRGGGVYVEDTAAVTINQTNITLNTSWWRGGGLYILNCNLTMTGGQLAHNDSTSNGGGLYMDAANKIVTLNHVSVIGNHAGGLGGGGYVSKGTLAGQLNAGQLIGNTAAGQGRNGSLPGIGVSLNGVWTITIAPGQQTVERNEL